MELSLIEIHPPIRGRTELFELLEAHKITVLALLGNTREEAVKLTEEVIRDSMVIMSASDKGQMSCSVRIQAF